MEAIIPKMTPFTYAPQTHHDIPAKNRLHSNMKKIDIEKSALCPCGLEAQTTAHVLQSCPLHKRERGLSVTFVFNIEYIYFFNKENIHTYITK